MSSGKPRHKLVAVAWIVVLTIAGLGTFRDVCAAEPTPINDDWNDQSDMANAEYGKSVASAGDVDGDGYSDVIVGCHKYTNGETHEGAVFVYLGNTTGLGSSPHISFESDSFSARVGGAVASAGDLNGDGYSD
ncbi:MAG: hypothetical protein GF418_16685, partial [Chitinivibrionales bacterium]|nr:hypothetical protein [Chitinivibrionales bacterium]MBD3397259.1 hypothetical protein [Chitinivibrionales bacterium]